MYKEPDNSGVVIKLVKEQKILPSTDNQASKYHESTILHCGLQEKSEKMLPMSSPSPCIVIIFVSCVEFLDMDKASR